MIRDWRPGGMMHGELVVWLQALSNKKDNGLLPVLLVNLHLVLSLPSYVSCLLYLGDLLIALRWFILGLEITPFY